MISDAAKKRAHELAAAFKSHNPKVTDAFAQYIQDVSDACKAACEGFSPVGKPYEPLAPFILPDDVDPLDASLREAWKQALSVYHATHLDKGAQDAACIERFKAVLVKRGIELGRADQ